MSLPSSLVRQRPDIRAAEELLHAASAQVGVATANLYPQLTLTGSFGTEADRSATSSAAGRPSGAWAPALLQPLFHGGELDARSAAPRSPPMIRPRPSTATPSCRPSRTWPTCCGPWRWTRKPSRPRPRPRRRHEIRSTSPGSSSGSGAVSYLSLLNAERQYRQVRISLVQAQAARFADTAALFQALGGGWWNRPRRPRKPQQPGHHRFTHPIPTGKPPIVRQCCLHLTFLSELNHEEGHRTHPVRPDDPRRRSGRVKALQIRAMDRAGQESRSAARDGDHRRGQVGIRGRPP